MNNLVTAADASLRILQSEGAPVILDIACSWGGFGEIVPYKMLPLAPPLLGMLTALSVPFTYEG
jgi:hypothetical protein